MAEEKIKVLNPETIEDQPFPQQAEGLDHSVSQTTSNDTFSTKKIKPNSFPVRRIATELIGASLNTKSKRILAEFEFTQSGALKIGNFVNGVTGDIRISPNGIIGRDKSGTVTFAIDSTTGSAVFKGTLQAGTFIGGGSKVIIDDDNGRGRILVLDDNNIPIILIGYQDGGF